MVNGVLTIPLPGTNCGPSGEYPGAVLRDHEVATCSFFSGAFFAGSENALAVAGLAPLLDRSQAGSVLLFGPHGSGKTHLARGLADHWLRHDPLAAVVYLTAGDFARDYAAAVDADRVDEWRGEIRRTELFVCENLGEFAGKLSAQQELVRTIDALQAQEASLVFTSSSVPNHWPALVPALRSRLSAALAIGLALPSRATRAALLRQLAAIRQMQLSDREVSQLSAIAGGAPRLLAALYRLALARQSGGAEADSALLSDAPTRQPSLREIAQTTAKHLGLKLADLKSPARQRSLVNGRGVAMHLARQLTTSSLEQIGRYFGGRDHTTVLHACRRTEKLLRRDRATRQTVSELKRLLRLAAT